MSYHGPHCPCGSCYAERQKKLMEAQANYRPHHCPTWREHVDAASSDQLIEMRRAIDQRILSQSADWNAKAKEVSDTAWVEIADAMMDFLRDPSDANKERLARESRKYIKSTEQDE